MDGFDLIEFEFRVADDVDFAGFGVFVYEEGGVVGVAGGGVLEDLLPFEHDGEDVAGVFGARAIFLDETAEEGFGVLFFDDFRFGVADWGFVGAFPEGERFCEGAGVVPCGEGEVAADEIAGGGVVEEGGVEGFALSEWVPGVGAGVGAAADVPVLGDRHVGGRACGRGEGDCQGKLEIENRKLGMVGSGNGGKWEGLVGRGATRRREGGRAFGERFRFSSVAERI